jgi:hypothetical protein
VIEALVVPLDRTAAFEEFAARVTIFAVHSKT